MGSPVKNTIMIRLLYLLIFGHWCDHKWKLIKEIKVFWDESDSIPSGTKYIMQCEKCGKMKKFKT